MSLEFSDKGKHCAVDTCRQFDLLPFYCEACKQYHCVEHQRRRDHECKGKTEKKREKVKERE